MPTAQSMGIFVNKKAFYVIVKNCSGSEHQHNSVTDGHPFVSTQSLTSILLNKVPPKKKVIFYNTKSNKRIELINRNYHLKKKNGKERTGKSIPWLPHRASSPKPRAVQTWSRGSLDRPVHWAQPHPAGTSPPAAVLTSKSSSRCSAHYSSDIPSL